jgi:bifunctional non-homologous end joining protein LigD
VVKKKRGITIDDLVARVADVQTAALAKVIPEPDAFTYELKWDGHRIVAVKAGDVVRLVGRDGEDHTKRLARIARDVARLPAEECAIDGVVCALDERGMPSLPLLQSRATKRAPLAFFVFDCLWYDGEDLRRRPIEDRRTALTEAVGTVDRKGSIVRSTASEGDPRALLELACKSGVDGIVAKRKGSTYSAGRRARTWLTVKCPRRHPC